MKNFFTYKKRHDQKGFTIVELLVATAVFQAVLLITIIAYLQISRYYQKSINAARLQQVAGNVVDEISHSIQNTGGLVAGTDLLGAIDNQAVGGAKQVTDSKNVTQLTSATIDGNVFSVLCVDTTRYFYRLGVSEPGSTLDNGQPAKPGDHVFLSETMTSPSLCASTTIDTNKLRVVMGQNMSLVRFGVAPNTAAGSYSIWLMAAYTLDVADDIDTSNVTPATPVNAKPDSGAYVACNGGAGHQYCSTANINTTVVRRIGL